MKSFVKIFTVYATTCFLLASFVYVILWCLMPNHYVFGICYRMFLYHWQHPFQYIALVSIIYGFVASIWSVTLGHLVKWKRVLSILGVMLTSIILSFIPGGMLWKIHDMQAGFFPEGDAFCGDLLWGAITGLEIGWFIILISIPYNILGVIGGYVVTDQVQKKMFPKGESEDLTQESVTN